MILKILDTMLLFLLLQRNPVQIIKFSKICQFFIFIFFFLLNLKFEIVIINWLWEKISMPYLFFLFWNLGTLDVHAWIWHLLGILHKSFSYPEWWNLISLRLNHLILYDLLCWLIENNLVLKVSGQLFLITYFIMLLIQWVFEWIIFILALA